MLEQIDVAVVESSRSVSFETIIESNFNSHKDAEFRIDYTIKMPRNLPLTVKNSFGDTYIGAYDGPTHLDIAYGNIKGETFTNDLRLELSFGGGNIGAVGKSELQVKYSNLKIGKMGSSTIDQRFSDLEIDELGDVSLDSKYGNLKLGSANNITGSVGYSGFSLDYLKQSVNLITSYSGDFRIKKVSKNFRLIMLDNKFGSCNVGLENGTNASIEARLKFCNLSFPGVPFNFHYEVKDNNSKEYKGKLGSGQGGVISITSDYGDVKFQMAD